MAEKDSPRDFEMGEEEEQDITPPKVNNYMNDIKKPEEPSKTEQPKVEPTDATPEAAPSQPPQQTIGQAKTGLLPKIEQNKTPITPTTETPTEPPKPPLPKKSKKALIAIIGAFAGVMLLLLILSFVFVSGGGEEEGAIAQLLGINQASFINGLITLVHIIFILFSLLLFVFIMIGLFKASMAKKDDKETKKKGLKMSLFTGIALIVVMISWVFVYVYLDAKRIQTAPELVQPIITEPEETLNLTAPVEIRFDASGVPIDKEKFQVISYEWDFGDDKIGTSQIVIHIYEEKGRYNVLLNVTKRNKKTGEEFTDQYSTIVSIAKQALSAIIKVDNESGEAPLEVKFDASNSIDPEGTIKRYEWDLDEDGEFDDDEGEEIEYEFEKIGRYTVALRITSSTGDYVISEIEIVVEEASLPEAIITVVDEPDTFLSGQSYVFKADDSTSPNGDIEKYSWDFGDGASANTKSASHSFIQNGTYEITLKVTDEEDKEGEVTKLITVGAPQATPKAVIKTEPTMGIGELSLKGTAPFEIVFDASGSTDSDNNIVDYEWDFDYDGTADDYGEKVTHTYNSEGSYTVKLSVIDADNNTGVATIPIKVESTGITALLKADKVDGNVPLTVDFDASGSTFDKGQITSYNWDFGDGTAPKLSTASISHKYTSIGTFTASVTAIGSDNSTSTAEIFITVREIPLTSCFTTVFDEGPAPLETSFDPGCSTGTIDSYLWSFGDGTNSASVKPIHTFVNPGEYTVTLEISDAENTIDKSSTIITVTE